jgi:hypothetical protein
MIVKVIGFDHGITCSGICRGSSSTLGVRKRQIPVIHYLRLSLAGLKLWKLYPYGLKLILAKWPFARLRG